MTDMPKRPQDVSVARLRRLAEIAASLDLTPVVRFANQMADDIVGGAATVLVCGEFKRGKSSVVNALIGQDLMPVDVLPTTAAIHVLRHAPTPGMTVHLRDGRLERRPLSVRALQPFAAGDAGGTVDPESVEYIEVGLTHDLFADGLVLVDTPGTNDLYKTRAEIVYRMIPRADAVVFVLNAQSQLTKSEVGFLTDRLVRTMAPPLCFVLNKSDTIEADARDEILDEVRSQLTTHLPGVPLTVLAVSARDPGIGVQDLAEFLRGFLRGSARAEAAAVKRARLFAAMNAVVAAAIDERLSMLDRSATDLAAVREEAAARNADLGIRLQRFTGYLTDQGPATLRPMVERSFRHHLDELIRRLEAEARAGGNAAWAANILPLHIERGLKDWLERKTPEIAVFLDRWQQAMAVEFARHFAPDTAIQHQAAATAFAAAQGPLTVDTADLGRSLQAAESQANLMRIGLPAAGAAVAAIVATGGMALLVGGALGGMIGFNQSQRTQEQARQLLAAQIGERVRQHGDHFLAAVLGELDQHAERCATGIRAAATDLAQRHLLAVESAHTAVVDQGGERDRQRQRLELLRAEVRALAGGT